MTAMLDLPPRPLFIKLHRPENAVKGRSFPVFVFRKPGTLDLDRDPRVRFVRIHSLSELPESRDFHPDERLTLNRIWHEGKLVAECTELSRSTHRPPPQLPNELSGMLRALRKLGAQILEETWSTDVALFDREPGSYAVDRDDCVRVPNHRTQR